MSSNQIQQIPWWGRVFLDPDIINLVRDLLRWAGKRLGILSSGNLHMTLDYESTLKIHDPGGERATFSKRKKICYLQDSVIAFPDFAWGDGEILLNYRTSRGKPVDRYRTGYKTYILLSLREVMNRGDVDEFDIGWNLRNGFLTEDG